LALGLLLLCSAIVPPANAATYTDPTGHYSFSHPDGWAESALSGVDVAVIGPRSGGFSPNIVATHGAEAGVQNTTAWLLVYVNAAYGQVRQLNVTEVQAPRVFTTNAGRLAGDYIYDRESSGMMLRQRQVIFVSAHYQTTYVLTFTDNSTSFPTHNPVWSPAVNTFVVSGEPVEKPFAGLSLGELFVVTGGGAAVAALAFSIVVMRRRRKQRAPLQGLAEAPGASPPASPHAPSGSSAISRPSAGWVAPPPVRADVLLEPIDDDSWPPASPAAAALTSPLGWSAPPVGQAPAGPTAPIAPPPPVPAPTRSAAPPKTIRCPKCGKQFPGPASRPAPVQCPFCGTRGMLK